jgi:hypothetical protein
MESMRAHFERDPAVEWTGYNGSLGRTLLNSENVLAKVAAAAEQPAIKVEELELAVLKAAAGDGSEL